MAIVHLVSRDDNRRSPLSAMLRDLGYSVALHDPEQLPLSAATQPALTVILGGHTMFPTGHLISQLKKSQPGRPIVYLVEPGEQQRAVEAVSAGAYDFLTWPPERERLDVTLRNALQATPNAITSTVDDTVFSEFVGRSADLMQLLLKARALSLGQTHFLISGERGTGKTMLARAMHLFSGAESGGLRTLGARSGEEIPVELDRAEAGSTIMIDLPEPSIADDRTRFDFMRAAEIAARRKIRLMLCQRTPRGDGSAPLTDPRLIEAFAPESVHLPPLRQRSTDIEAQCDFFLLRSAKMLQRPVLRPTSQARRLLLAFDWPGNTRQLIDTVFRAHLIADGPHLAASQIEPLLAGDTTRSPVAALPSISPFNGAGELRRLEDIEADYMKLAFHVCRKNRSEIARQLGIGRTTLYRKARQLALM